MPYKDPAKKLEHDRKWRDANREKVRESQRKYRAANLEKVREKGRKYVAAHAEKVRESNRQWREANPEKLRELVRKWFARHPMKAAEYKNRRRARKAGNGGSYTVEELQALYAYYDYQCIGPGPHKGPLTVDHVIPILLGGPNVIENIQPLCQPCNSRKGTKTIDYRQILE